ncbi:hypothetical protein [Neorhizobium sp. DT-125]|uniref:hypothetical protein n=1 Tax=Neorhizobium sp. DT-125 TaxID=3396163 RepID=UPI003F19A95F
MPFSIASFRQSVRAVGCSPRRSRARPAVIEWLFIQKNTGEPPVQATHGPSFPVK